MINDGEFCDHVDLNQLNQVLWLNLKSELEITS